MNQDPGSTLWTSLTRGEIAQRTLSPQQLNNLVATVSSRLTPDQRNEIKGFFVFGEAPSKSTRVAFEVAAQNLIQNQPILDAIVQSA
jgi:hypothetical protein